MAGRQAAAGEPPLASLLATGLPHAAGTWAPHVMAWNSSPAPVYSRLHWAAPNSPPETLGLTLAQIFQWMVSSKLSNKGFLNHADVRPLSKIAARGPLSRYRLEAELRTTTSGCTPEQGAP